MLRLWTKLFTALSIALTAGVAASAAVLLEGARVIVDARRPPIENAALLIDHGRVIRVGPKGTIQAPAGAKRVELSGKTVIPALIDAHVHLGYQKGLAFSADNFNRDNLVDLLNRYAYCGIGAVLSLGTDVGDLPFRLRAEQAAGRLGGALYLTAGRGLAAPNAGPGTPELKASAYGISTAEDARRAVREQVARKVDFIKIWVDDRNGTVPKLNPALYRAAIDEAHKLGTRVIAHVYYLDDAKDLARAGIDGFAHLARDREMDAEMIELITQRHIVVIPNLAISENGTHSEPPAWLDDPLLHAVASAAAIDRARSSYKNRSAIAAERARKIYGDMQRSLAQLNAAGARIGFGTDAGAVRDHFYAYTDHRELQLMVAAGMTPAQALTAATATSAKFLRLRDRGTLEPGRSADFVILDANPLENIANTQKIAGVYLRGREINRRWYERAWK